MAKKRLVEVQHSKLLEEQQLSNIEHEKAFETEVEELIRNMPKVLWDDHDGL